MKAADINSELFWSKVDVGDDGSCWPWMAGKSANGYGAFAVKRRVFVATHIALTLDGRERPEPPNDQALHSCANPICVNPAHLRWGTNAENMADMVRDGHAMFGERSSTAVLTEEDVRSIRQSSASLRSLAARYGVQFAAIHKIRSRRTWRHLA